MKIVNISELKNRSEYKDNIYYSLAMNLWARGEDGEAIAREMANALKEIMKLGMGKGVDLAAEFKRLTSNESSN